MLAVVLHVLGFTASAVLASITVRNFSLVTDKGEDVFQTYFDRRRLRDSIIDRIALKFNAMEKNFEFEFEISHPIFAPGATIEMTGRVQVREHKKAYGNINTAVICYTLAAIARARVHTHTHRCDTWSQI